MYDEDSWVMGHSKSMSFTLEDLNADYELRENAVTITKKQFWDAVIKCGLIRSRDPQYSTYRTTSELEAVLREMLAELGFK